MAFDAIQPLPDRRLDYYLAHIALMLGNRWRDPKSPAYGLDDFLLFPEYPKAPRTEQDVEDDLKLIFG